MEPILTTRVARLGSKLAETGIKHRDISSRISALEHSKTCENSAVALERLRREKKRLEENLHQYEARLSMLSRQLSA